MLKFRHHYSSALALQFGVLTFSAAVLAVLVGGLYLQSRQREWALRCEQSTHRLNLAFELISREIARVRSDALFLASQEAVRSFASGDTSRRDELAQEYASFLDRKAMYDQLRLLDLSGRETIRVNYSASHASFVEPTELQDKSSRYYFQQSLALGRDEVFVSDFDLNVEHGQIETPLKPVIRFVTPVFDDNDHQCDALLVLNYLGAGLLEDLNDVMLPGVTLLVRPDGHYLYGLEPHDAWGWLLGHSRTFAKQFPAEWSCLADWPDCYLTDKGAFAAIQIPLNTKTRQVAESAQVPFRAHATDEKPIIVVAHLPRNEVFQQSNELLQRLLVLSASVFLIVAAMGRYWARATTERHRQSQQLAASEDRLRDLSSRLLRIQEDERRAISREIHDEFGQQVTAISLDLKLAERHMGTDMALPHLRRAIAENAMLLQSLHDFATRVRPAVLDDLGLHDAIESHLTEFERRTGVTVVADLDFRTEQVPHEIADHMYRLLQESLNNVAKHANASTVQVKIWIEDSPSQLLAMTLTDDGRGYDDSGSRSGLGLIGMRERIDLVSGEIAMSSTKDQGTRITIRIPLRAQTVKENAV